MKVEKISDSSKVKGKWLFLAGCPRSGTTLLNLILNEHPEINILNEVNFQKLFVRINNIFYREQRVLEIISNPRQKASDKENWSGKQILNLVPQRKHGFEQILDAIFYQFNGNNTNIWRGDKLPLYYKDNFAFFKENFQKPKIILVLRAPIATINSIIARRNNARRKKDKWDKSQTIYDAINDWIDAWNTAVDYKNSKDFLHPIKYEDILSNPNDVCNGIMEFLTLENNFEPSHDINSKNSNLILSEAETKLILKHLSKVEQEWENDLSKNLEKIGRLERLKVPFSVIIWSGIEKISSKIIRIILLKI